MLPPFQLRNLHSHEAGTVQISASEYDDVVATKPTALLTYLDDDDGEIITIGSSFELGERLQEPAPASRYSYKDSDLKDNPMHIFDISGSEEAVNTWKNFESRTAERNDAKRPTPTKPESPPIKETLQQLEENARRYLSRDPQSTLDELEVDIKTRWLRACQPPQLSQDTSEAMPGFNGSKEVSGSLSAAGSPTTLTPEGQRLAKEAGDRLRWNVESAKGKGRASTVSSSEENRWASYQSMDKASQPTELSPSISQPSFLEAFEAELAKHVIKEDQTSEPQVNGMTSPSTRHARTDSNASTQDAGVVVVQAVQALATGVSLLGSELSRRFPELEEQISSVQKTLPGHVDKAVNDAIGGLSTHADKLSKTLQQASEASRNAAERTRQADLQTVNDMIHSFSGFIGDVGKTLWTTLEKEVNRNRAASEAATTTTAPSDSEKLTVVPPTQEASPEEAPKSCSPNCLIGNSREHIRCILPEPTASADDKDTKPRALSSERTQGRSHFVEREIAYPQLDTRPISEAASPAATAIPVEDAAPVQPTTELRRPKSLAVLPPRPIYVEIGEPSTRPLFKKNSDATTSQRHELATGRPTSPVKEAHHTLRGMVSTPSFIKPILDQEDADPEFTRRYPSLISSNALHRSNTTGSKMTSSAYLKTMNPESEIARFPTVSQLERQSIFARDMKPKALQAAAKIKPTLPPIVTTMKRATSVQFKPPKATTPVQRLPGAWPELPLDTASSSNLKPLNPAEESSGAFFERMTGRRATAMDDSLVEDKENKEPSSLRRAHTTAGTTAAADPAARLAGPFDPLNAMGSEDASHGGRVRRRYRKDRWRAETASQNANDNTDGADTLWSQSSFRPNSQKFEGARRPYSVHFTGAGRSGALNQLIAPDFDLSTKPRLSRPKSMYSITSLPPPPPVSNPFADPEPHRPPPPPPPTISMPHLPMYNPPHPPHPAQPPHPPRPHRPAMPAVRIPPSEPLNPAPPKDKNSKIEECVANLRRIGYGQPNNGVGAERLRVYALAAEGDVAEAVDIIEDERRAWARLNRL